MKKHYKALDGLRGVAAVTVVFAHLEVLLRAIHVPVFGHAGVDLFFVISGFVIAQSTACGPSVAEFCRARIIRIVPLYWLLTICIFAIAAVAPQLVGATKADPLQLIESLLFIPFEKGNGIVPVLFVGWTLNYEMAFYALFAAALALFRRHETRLAFVVSVLAALIAGGAIFHPGAPIARFYTSPIVGEFALGIGCWALLRALPTPTKSASLALIIGLAIALPVLIASSVIWDPALRWMTAGPIAAIVLVLALLLERTGRRVATTFTSKLGAASYALYLCQPYIAKTFDLMAKRLHPAPPLTVAMIGCCLCLAIVSAMALHAFVEKPMTRKLKAADRPPGMAQAA